MEPIGAGLQNKQKNLQWLRAYQFCEKISVKQMNKYSVTFIKYDVRLTVKMVTTSYFLSMLCL